MTDDSTPTHVRALRARLGRLVRASLPYRAVKTRWSLARNGRRDERRLDIGPGGSRLPGFETLDVVGARHVDYLVDASGPLPFADGTFTLIHASHVLEHIPWQRTRAVVEEWARCLAPGGTLEIWVPDAVKICEAFLDYEVRGIDRTDEWRPFNPDSDPCLWTTARLFRYGDDHGSPEGPGWHHALFSARYLKKTLEGVGLVDVAEMDAARVRGYDHGWISLGVEGTKP